MWILTAVGPDTPGMAHAVAQILFDLGCNIEDTTMTRLSGHFSMLLAVEPPASLSVQQTRAALQPLQASHGLSTDVLEVGETPEDDADDLARFILTAYGAEKTGLLARLTGELAAKGVNVTDVQTRVASSGSVYVMLLEVELPTSLDSTELEAALRTNLSDLQISLRSLEEETL